MPAPDVQYVLDGALECCHITADTHRYFMEMAPDADSIVDGCDHLGVEDGRRHWHHLSDMGIHLEEHYVRWRISNPGMGQAASVAALSNAPNVFKEMSDTYGGVLASAGFRTMGRSALDHLDERFDATRTSQVVRRSLARAAADLAGWTNADFEDHYAARRRERPIFRREEICRGGDDEDWERILRTKARLRKAAETDQRKVIKRSARLLSKLIGSDSTRMFVGGEALRIEGRHAVYEIRKESTLDSSHGGFQALAVYDRDDPRILLCKVCIVTNDVPLLDHVASLILHIRAGMEDEILRIGNAREISNEAYERKWLLPHLPERRKKGEALGPMDRCLFTPEPPGMAEARARMRIIAARRLFADVFAPHMGLIREAAPHFGRTSVLRDIIDQRILAARKRTGADEHANTIADDGRRT